MEINKYGSEKGSFVITCTFGTYILDHLVKENQNSFLLFLTLSFLVTEGWKPQQQQHFQTPHPQIRNPT
jgi:hypothetical protein